MSETNNQTVQDANVLVITLRKHSIALADYGVTEEGIVALETLTADVQQKALTFQVAENTRNAYTNQQNQRIADVQAIIQTIKTAAKGAFPTDKVIQHEFHIGIANPIKVSDLTAEALYIKEASEKYAPQLLKRGIKPELIAELISMNDELVRIDREQEDSKHSQKTLRAERDAAVKELKAMKRNYRNSAAVCFAKNKTILAEFRSIIPNNKSRKTTTPTEPETGTNG